MKCDSSGEIQSRIGFILILCHGPYLDNASPHNSMESISLTLTQFPEPPEVASCDLFRFGAAKQELKNMPKDVMESV
jgi:hypothetical protein